MILQKKYLSLAISACFLSSMVQAEDTTTSPGSESESSLPPIVITAESMDEPLKVVTDPKAARQPLPAHDGADYLKSIPGFNVTRKSGTDGDAIFRGMAGSRLGILVDGESILGGCNARMDAPTAYIFPEIYDELTVIKGPQTVIYGPSTATATVMFDRKHQAFTEADTRVYASALLGSFGRQDALVDGEIGNQTGYARLTANHSASDDYADGDDEKVHSEYRRYSASLAAGWTPDDNTRLEISADRSDGEAAYADRAMDGTQFLREGADATLEKTQISNLISKMEVRAYTSDVDHIMDDQTLREPGMMGYSNLLRETQGGKLATTLELSQDVQATLGMDTQNNQHQSRSAPAMTGIYSDWVEDAEFSQRGVFAELRYDMDEQNRIVAGLRADFWEATDQRSMIMTNMMTMTMQMNPTAGDTRNETLHSGFARIEHRLSESDTTLYVGVGHSERFPDYWEMISKQGETGISAFNTPAETTEQLDLGALYQNDKIDASLALFYNQTDDFILIDYSYVPTMMDTNTSRAQGFSRSIDAHSYGAEASLNYAINNNWKSETSIATVRGSNETDNTSLPQLPPLEVRLGLTYAQDNWTSGGLLRWVDDQTHYATNMGNIVGKDLGEGEGFSVFSLNTSWKPSADSLISGGIDNVFDETYAEFVSRAGSDITGYVQNTRVNEPGRLLWIKAQIRFD